MGSPGPRGPGEQPSPLGEFAAKATAQGYRDTARVAERMTAFNPDETWKKVDTTALD